MPGIYEKLEDLVKVLEAGGYNAAPDTLRQGSALQVEDCSPVMENVTFEDKHIILQKDLSVKPAKSTLVQFNRRLSYGRFGGSAQLEGAVGQERTSDYVRATVPMCYYSEIRRTTLASNMVNTQTGEKPEDLEASAAALNLAGDIEFDSFRGKDDFSNAGVFDGNPAAIPALPNMQGAGVQIRMSDNQVNTQDLMFDAYGGGLSVVISGGGVLQQTNIEDANVRSSMNHGSADKLIVDPLALSAYNKVALGKERIVLAGSAQEATGADLRRQWVMGGTIQLKASRFLSGKYKSLTPTVGAPAAPTISLAASSGTTAFKNGNVFTYYVTGENEIGEGPRSGTSSVTLSADGQQVAITITPGSGTNRFFNVYRSSAGGGATSIRFIGRVINLGGSTTTFTDLGNKIPGFVTGYLIQDDTMELAELAPYSRLKLAVSSLSEPEAHFRFVTLKVTQPRKNVLVDNLIGSF